MNRHKRNAGFSLIEIMIAILILGVALTGLTQGITTALSSSKASELQTAAGLIASGQIETLRAEKELDDGVTEGECGEALPSCSWTLTVSPTDLDGLHDVKVVVQKTDSGEEICELSTLLFDPDYPSQDENAAKNDHGRREKRPKGRGAE
jgi:prepilin-type N-terminal cleavage/methylation domain-containing protein